MLPILLHQKRIRYLIFGAWNTVFGYFAGIGLYYSLRHWLHIIPISCIANILAITMSFLTYKIFVFQTKGNWLLEYCRCYIVYGGVAIVGVLVLWVLVDVLGVAFWIGQGLVIVIAVIASYVSHEKFTFNKTL